MPRLRSARRSVPLTDKAEVISSLKQYGYDYVAAIGDGANDRAMQREADAFAWVCPKDGLAKPGERVITDLRELPGLLEELYSLKSEDAMKAYA